jgi:hypothetical protein
MWNTIVEEEKEREKKLNGEVCLGSQIVYLKI